MARVINYICLLGLLLPSLHAVKLSDPLLQSRLREEARTQVDNENGKAQAQAVLAQMTLEEKTSLLRGTHFDILKSMGPDQGYYTGYVPPIPRLGIPALKMSDAGNGFRPTEANTAGTSTSWPCLLSLASTWDTDLVGHVARSIGEEFRGKGANVILGPSINVHRTARGGRNFEYMSGEDPYLGAALASKYVDEVSKAGVMAMPKHYAFNEQETNRMLQNSVVDEQAAWEIYYPPFEAAVKGGAGAIMCAYNKVNGTFACHNKKLLKTDLKGKMEFDGFVTSDWMATHSVKALEGGLDMEMPGEGLLLQMSDRALKSTYRGRESIFDEAVMNILTSVYRLHLDEHPGCTPPYCHNELRSNQSTKEHLRLAADAATNAITLLKNDGDALPITPAQYKSIAILGKAAFEHRSNYYNGGGSGAVPAAFVKWTGDEIARKAVSLGITVITADDDSVQGAVEAAKKADLAIVVGGTSASEGMDRMNLHLDGEVDKTVSAVAGVTKTVVLMQTPGAVIMPWRNEASAILNLFLGGQLTGEAWTNVLFGDKNPSGKLPIMMPATEHDVIEPGVSKVEYSEDMLTSYRNPDLKAAFPFGHGLSYTSFEYAPLTPLDQSDHDVYVIFKVTNTGKRAGSEVVQTYLEFPDAVKRNPHYPKMQLRGFHKTKELQPGESEEVWIYFVERDLSTYNVATGAWEREDHVKVHAGSSSADIRQSVEVNWPFDQAAKDAEMLKRWQAAAGKI